MDRQIEKGSGLEVLGECDTGHVRGTVHGGRRNLWSGHIHSVPGRGNSDCFTPVNSPKQVLCMELSYFTFEVHSLSTGKFRLILIDFVLSKAVLRSLFFFS